MRAAGVGGIEEALEDKDLMRVRVFAWIMTHGKLLTNLERWKKRLTDCPDCSRCCQATEDVQHTIRDCAWAREVWEVIIPQELKGEFISLELHCVHGLC